MFNNLKASIRKFLDVSGPEFWKFLKWGGSPTDNSQALICSASCNGKTVAYVTAEPIYLVSNYALNPEATPSDLQKAGDAIDYALASEGQRLGVGRFFVVVPEGAPKIAGERTLRFIERKLPQEITFTDDSFTKQLLSVSADNTTAEWVN